MKFLLFKLAISVFIIQPTQWNELNRKVINIMENRRNPTHLFIHFYFHRNVRVTKTVIIVQFKNREK